MDRHRPNLSGISEAADRCRPSKTAVDRHPVVVELWWAQRLPERGSYWYRSMPRPYLGKICLAYAFIGVPPSFPRR
jgi:hypothetical protein